MSVNETTQKLQPYPMETLTRFRQEARARGQEVFDFGTGDPKIPTWAPIREAIAKALPIISQYPSVKGNPELVASIWGYLGRRFGIQSGSSLKILPTNGSKEAIFSVALSLIGRAGGRKVLIYPDPGYPVYQASALFAGGQPYPVRLHKANGYLLEPWELPRSIQDQAAAIWINYPHNPTGAMAPRDYFVRVIDWANQHGVVLLADDCYVDTYDASFDAAMERDSSHDVRPISPIMLTETNVISFLSLSKRSGLTGYRSGAMVGDAKLMADIERARANFGCATPNFIQAGAQVAWSDEQHVLERRRIFTDRIDAAFGRLHAMGIIDHRPDATFYLWCKVPKAWGDDDVSLTLELAQKGIICQPSQWLSEGVKGYIRFALVPEIPEILRAFSILEDHIAKKSP
jgi:succinyldiaminopimelate transaminase